MDRIIPLSQNLRIGLIRFRSPYRIIGLFCSIYCSNAELSGVVEIAFLKIYCGEHILHPGFLCKMFILVQQQYRLVKIINGLILLLHILVGDSCICHKHGNILWIRRGYIAQFNTLNIGFRGTFMITLQRLIITNVIVKSEDLCSVGSFLVYRQ